MRHLEVVVGVVRVPLPLGPAHAGAAAEARDAAFGILAQAAAGHERRHADAVHPDVKRVRGVADAADVVVEVPAQADPDAVLAVEREVVPHGNAAARSERQVVARVVVLDFAVGHPVRIEAGPQRGVADRELAHLPRGVQVALHQRRRDRQHVGDVVEPLVLVIRGEQRFGVDLDPEEIVDGVAVLHAVQSMRGRAAGVGVGGGGPIQLALEPARNRVVGGGVGARPAGRRHHAGTELQRHLLPGRRVRPHVRRIESLEGDRNEARGEPAVAVTGDAVPVQHRAHRLRGCGNRGPRCRWRAGRRRFRAPRPDAFRTGGRGLCLQAEACCDREPHPPNAQPCHREPPHGELPCRRNGACALVGHLITLSVSPVAAG